MPKHKIQHMTFWHDWVDSCLDGETGLPILFDTRKAAEDDLKDFFADVKAAVKSGHMQDLYSRNEWRIVETADTEEKGTPDDRHPAETNGNLPQEPVVIVSGQENN